MQTHTSREIAEAMIAAAERRHNIWNSLYAAVLGLVPDEREHPGYEDMIVTRECDRTDEIASAPLAVAWLNARYGVQS